MSDHTYPQELDQPHGDPSDADRLYNDFAAMPAETWLAVTAELFGDEAASRLASSLHADEVPEHYGDAYSEIPAHMMDDHLTPEERDAVNYAADLRRSHIEQQQEDQYTNALTNFLAGSDIDPNALHPFVAATDGDLDAALEAYREWQSQGPSGQPNAAVLTEFARIADGDMDIATDMYRRYTDLHGPKTPAERPSAAESPRSMDDAINGLISDMRKARTDHAQTDARSSLHGAVDEFVNDLRSGRQ